MSHAEEESEEKKRETKHFSHKSSHLTITSPPTMSQKKILVLGSGMVAKPCVDFLLRDINNRLTIGQCFPLPFLFLSRPLSAP